jgi:hypothetical protein
MTPQKSYIITHKNKLIPNSLFWLFICLLFTACNSSKEEIQKKVKAYPDTTSIADINFNSEQDENSILLYLQMQEEYALTLKQFNSLFNSNLKRTGLDKRFDSGEIPKSKLNEIKQSFFIQVINEEILYQEGLRNPDIRVLPQDIAKKLSKEVLRNSTERHITFEQYLERIGLTNQELSLAIKKSIFIKNVQDNQMRFMTISTPNEIEDLYNQMVNSGQFSKKFREVYLIEFPSSSASITPTQLEDLKDLAAFQKFAKEESIHKSAKMDGRIEDVPNTRSIDQKNNPKLISNLFFDDIWQFNIGVVNYKKIGTRQFLIWVNKEFDKQNQLTQEVQQYLARILYNQKKFKLEEMLTLKIANNFTFKVRINNELVPLNLKKFIQKSIEVLQSKED